jgi:hypothetical protein
MLNNNDITRAQAAVRTMEHNRAEARALLKPHRAEGAGGQPNAFPRSKTFRWLLTHPVGRSLSSALLSGALSRLPIGRFIGCAPFGRKTYR